MLIRDRVPAYIPWDEFEKNQQKLKENSNVSKMLSAPRHGPSTLSGLIVCGRCGYHMLVGYANTGGDSNSKTLRYSCQREAIDYGKERCQSLSGVVLEAFVGERLLQAVSPASLALSLSATEDIARERKQLDEHWSQRLTRSRFEAELARRRYTAVDPDHRLVARELERRWDEALRAHDQLRAEYDRFTRERPTELSDAERGLIQSLAEDPPNAMACSINHTRRPTGNRSVTVGRSHGDRRGQHGPCRGGTELGWRLHQSPRIDTTSTDVRTIIKLQRTGSSNRDTACGA